MEAEKKEQIIKEVIHCAYVVRYNLGEGFLESVYQNAMMIELSKLGLHVEKEKQINVYYVDDTLIGVFKADILVEDFLILELKTVAELTNAHEMQLVNYLKATRIDDGLLINFYGKKVQVKRKFREFQRI
uniref:GxxExxY protein n=1 Tax=Alloprevotella sp. TaxID=1872471 RepID=UPI003FEF5DA5